MCGVGYRSVAIRIHAGTFGVRHCWTIMRAILAATMIVMLGAAEAMASPRSLVPEGWREVDAPGSGNKARTFVSPDGAARLRLGHVEARRENLRRDMDALTYRDGEIFYRKSNLACRGTRWHTIELRYPREAKRRLDPVVTSIARSMGAYGSDCG
jgi:hypothetical protein